MTPDAIPPICELRVYDGVVYHCGRTLLYRDPTKKEEAYPGGTFFCLECPTDEIERFFRQAYDAQAVRQEWEGG